MFLQVCLFFLLVIKCYGYQSSWNSGYDRYRIPQDVIVDVVNNLALKLLAIHNEGNDNNIAISPYGALSVLVALKEGVRGSAENEIHRASGIPSDISVVRVGLRDIHRHLKSYFIPDEGFLSGLTLSHDNVTLNREYEDILRFYGFDIDSFNNALYPELVTSSTETSTTELATEASTSTTEAMTSTEKLAEKEEVTSTEISTTENMSTTENEISTTENGRTTRSETTVTTSGTSALTTLTTKEIVSTPKGITTTVLVEQSTTSEATTVKESTLPTETTTSLKELNSSSESSTTTTTNRESTTNVITTTEATTLPQNAITTTEISKTTLENTETELNRITATTEILSTTSEPSTIISTEKITTVSEFSLNENKENLSTTEISAETESSSMSDFNDTTEQSEMSSTTVFDSTTKTLNDETAETSSEISSTTTLDTTTNSLQLNDETARYSDESKNNNTTSRNTRSVVDYIIARYYDDRIVTQRPPPYNSENDLYFLINGKYKETNINYMTYDTVLPFLYLSNMNALALRFPLDSSKYYLLLLLPEDPMQINKLICDLKMKCDLKCIIDNLKYTHVKAIIPSFMLKGNAILTSTFQKMGIYRVFEPRQADFSPMTGDRGIYVTNIEQAITVNIRNYVDPATMNSNQYLHRSNPVLFKADHPFLYFVIDSEINVTLMAGKIVNPLNSRIR